MKRDNTSKINDLKAISAQASLESGVIPVPKDFFSSYSGVFGRNPLRLFGPELKKDLLEMRGLMDKSSKLKYKHFPELETAKSLVKELMPQISSRRANDLAIALYWQLREDAIKLSDDYSSYESFKDYLQNNDYGLMTLSATDVVENSVIGGNLNCLIAVGHENSRGQAGFLKGIFPDGSRLRCGNAEQKHETIHHKDDKYSNRLLAVRSLMDSIGANSRFITELMEHDSDEVIREYDDIIAKMAIEDSLLGKTRLERSLDSLLGEEEQDSDTESDEQVSILSEPVPSQSPDSTLVKTEAKPETEETVVSVDPVTQSISDYAGKTAVEDEDSSSDDELW
jgi:hypothetical protein